MDAIQPCPIENDSPSLRGDPAEYLRPDMLPFRKSPTPNLIARNLIMLSLSGIIALLTACGPTGNRLNSDVIIDPRSQFDPNDTSGNQGTATPTDASGPSTIIDPSVALSPPTGGSNTSSNSNQQTSGSPAPAGIFVHTTAPASIVATSPSWALALNPNGAFALQHRAQAYGSIDLRLYGARKALPDGSLLFTITNRQGDGLPGVAVGDVISGIEWKDHLILLNGNDLAARDMIPLTIAATCPDNDINAIWLESGTVPDAGSTGTLTYTAPAGTAFQTVAIKPLMGQALTGRSFVNLACAKTSTLGLASNASRNSNHITLAATGAGILTSGTTQALVLPIPAPMTLDGLAGDYIGLHGSQGATRVAALHCDDLGHCSDDNAPVALQFDALNAPANGISTGALIDQYGLSSPMTCISGINGKLGDSVSLLACRTTASAHQGAIFVRTAP